MWEEVIVNPIVLLVEEYPWPVTVVCTAAVVELSSTVGSKALPVAEDMECTNPLPKVANKTNCRDELVSCRKHLRSLPVSDSVAGGVGVLEALPSLIRWVWVCKEHTH